MDDELVFKYQIGGKTYIQKRLVLGQIRQMIDCLKGTAISNFHPLNIYNQLRDRIGKLLAIVLTEEGKTPQGKDLETMAGEIEFSIDPEGALQVIEDFFVCNPIASIKERLEGMTEKIAGRPLTGSKRPSSFSQEETLPGETKSSGDIPHESASLSSGIL